MRTIDLLVLHCSASRADRTYTEHDLAVDHRRRGFDGPAYHYYVRRDGRIVSTRPVEHPGMHTQGYNARSIGICYEGGIDAQGRPADTRTKWQLHSLRVLMRVLREDYPGCRVCGHRDLLTAIRPPGRRGEPTPEEWVKECPCFDAAKEYGE